LPWSWHQTITSLDLYYNTDSKVRKEARLTLHLLRFQQWYTSQHSDAQNTRSHNLAMPYQGVAINALLL
jgi:hypothetical protein